MLHALDRYGTATSSAALIVAMLCVVACSVATRNESTDAQVRLLTPALRLTFDASSATPSAPYQLRKFTFVSEPPHEWPYGTGFAVADRTSGEVLWIYL